MQIGCKVKHVKGKQLFSENVLKIYYFNLNLLSGSLHII